MGCCREGYGVGHRALVEIVAEWIGGKEHGDKSGHTMLLAKFVGTARSKTGDRHTQRICRCEHFGEATAGTDGLLHRQTVEGDTIAAAQLMPSAQTRDGHCAADEVGGQTREIGSCNDSTLLKSCGMTSTDAPNLLNRK